MAVGSLVILHTLAFLHFQLFALKSVVFKVKSLICESFLDNMCVKII